MTPEQKIYVAGAVWSMVWVWAALFVYLGTKSLVWFVLTAAVAVPGPLFALLKILKRRDAAATAREQDIVQ